jgi:hypothetical protein
VMLLMMMVQCSVCLRSWAVLFIFLEFDHHSVHNFFMFKSEMDGHRKVN